MSTLDSGWQQLNTASDPPESELAAATRKQVVFQGTFRGPGQLAPTLLAA